MTSLLTFVSLCFIRETRACRSAVRELELIEPARRPDSTTSDAAEKVRNDGPIDGEREEGRKRSGLPVAVGYLLTAGADPAQVADQFGIVDFALAREHDVGADRADQVAAVGQNHETGALRGHSSQT